MLRNILSEPFREKCSATKKRQAMRFDELRSLFLDQYLFQSRQILRAVAKIFIDRRVAM